MVKKFLDLFNKEIGGLHEAAYLLAFFAFLSQLLALVRDKLLAHNFGASPILDIYYAAFRVPDLIFVSIASVVSASVLIPFFMEKANQDPEKGKHFVNNLFSAFFFTIILVSVVIFIFAPTLLRFLLPGFARDYHFSELVTATRILLLSPFFLGISNFLSSITQIHKRFLVYALSPIVYNIGIIAGILFLYPFWGLNGLIWGVVVGSLLHMVIQIPFIVHKKVFPKLIFSIEWNSIKKIVFISLPRTLTLASNQLASFFLVALASLMSAGSISVFNLAFNLQSVPLTIVGVSYSSAVFPTLSRFFVKGERTEFLGKMIESARHIVFWSIPVTVLFVVLRAQIVRTIYGSGNFDWADTRLTAAALALFIVSVMGQSLVLLFVRAYYAEGKTRKPLIINIISGIVIAVTAYALTKAFFAFPMFRFFLEDLLKVVGQRGTSVLVLPLAYSIGVFLNTYLHWHLFAKDHPGFTRPVLSTLFHSFSASVIMGYVTFISLRFFNIFFTLDKAWGVFLQGLCAGVVGIVAGIAILHLLKNQELKEVTATLRRKIWKAKVVVPDQESL